jgi:hypothetical protein
MPGGSRRGGRWPNLFLVGAPLAGSESLCHALAQHPQVWVPRVSEPHFFAGIRPAGRMDRPHEWVSDQQQYLALFAADRAVAHRVDASTSYLWSAQAPGRIHAAVPDARVVLCLRDPIERAIAHWQREQARGVERRGFLRSVRDEMAGGGEPRRGSVYLTASRYADGVERFLGLFGRDRVELVFYEMLVADPLGTVRDLFRWLGIEEAVAALLKPQPEQDRHASLADLDPVIRRLLAEFYAPDVARLSGLLGVIPPWSVQALEHTLSG